MLLILFLIPHGILKVINGQDILMEISTSPSVYERKLMLNSNQVLRTEGFIRDFMKLHIIQYFRHLTTSELVQVKGLSQIKEKELGHHKGMIIAAASAVLIPAVGGTIVIGDGAIGASAADITLSDLLATSRGVPSTSGSNAEPQGSTRPRESTRRYANRQNEEPSNESDESTSDDEGPASKKRKLESREISGESGSETDQVQESEEDSSNIIDSSSSDFTPENPAEDLIERTIDNVLEDAGSIRSVTFNIEKVLNTFKDGLWQNGLRFLPNNAQALSQSLNTCCETLNAFIDDLEVDAGVMDQRFSNIASRISETSVSELDTVNDMISELDEISRLSDQIEES